MAIIVAHSINVIAVCPSLSRASNIFNQYFGQYQHPSRMKLQSGNPPCYLRLLASLKPEHCQRRTSLAGWLRILDPSIKSEQLLHYSTTYQSVNNKQIGLRLARNTRMTAIHPLASLKTSFLPFILDGTSLQTHSQLQEKA